MRGTVFTWLVLMGLVGFGCPSADDDDSAVSDDDDATGDDDDATGDDDDSTGDDDDSTGDDDDSTEPPDPEVLLLSGPGAAGELLKGELTTAGVSFTEETPYSTWDGVNPNVNDFDVVVWFEGDDYGSGLEDVPDAALVAWLEGGGRLIRTEWGAYSIGDEPDPGVDERMPVVAPLSDYDYSPVWTADDTNHPLAAGVPATWTTVDDGCSIVNAQPNTTVVMSTDLCGPAVTILPVGPGGGRVIHINSDFGADLGAALDPNIVQVLLNAVRWPG